LDQEEISLRILDVCLALQQDALAEAYATHKLAGGFASKVAIALGPGRYPSLY